MEKITIIKEWNLFGSSLTVSQTTQPVKLYSPSDVLERSGGVLISSSGSSGHDAAGCGSGHQVRLGSFRDAGNLLVLYKVSRTNLATIAAGQRADGQIQTGHEGSEKTGGSKAKRQIWRRELRGVWNETFSASPLHRPRCAYLDRCRSQQKYGPLLRTGK